MFRIRSRSKMNAVETPKKTIVERESEETDEFNERSVREILNNRRSQRRLSPTQSRLLADIASLSARKSFRDSLHLQLQPIQEDNNDTEQKEES
jgi:hypothetical protein